MHRFALPIRSCQMALAPRLCLSVLAPGLRRTVVAARLVGDRQCATSAASTDAPALSAQMPEAAALSAAFERRVSSGHLQADPSQERAVQLLVSGLTRAADVACERRDAHGPTSWVKPTRTLGTAEAAAAASDRQRVAAYTAGLAAENARRVRKQSDSQHAQRQTKAADAPSQREAKAADVSSQRDAKVPMDGSPPRPSSPSSATSAEAAGVATRGDPKGDDAKKAPVTRPSRQSVYMHGTVGTGKTMLLDLFFEHARQAELRVVRQHFYEFMLSLHERIHAIEELQPVEVAANMIADDVDVLCFDEFQLTDIQDAVILPRLFEVLFLRGVVIIMTSNTAPPLLYSGGLNRHVHLPAFIGLLADYCHVLRLGGSSPKSSVDYRRRAEALELAEVSSDTSSSAQLELDGYLCGDDAMERLRARWQELIQGAASPAPEQLRLPMGRRLQVTEATGDACFVAFEELCGTDRGEAEFLALAQRFSTIALAGVPLFVSLEATDKVKRFVKLLDVLYDRRVRLVIAAAAPIDELFVGIRRDVQQGDIMWRTTMYSSDGKVGMAPGAVGTLCETIQASERAESRLREMRTRRYAQECAAARPQHPR